MSPPTTIRDVRAMQAWSDRERAAGRTIGFVPTMGALHEGHLDLVRRARADCDLVVVSIFVNPTQFAPGEDFAAYPRTFERDVAALTGVNCDVVFAPTTPEMYPTGEERFIWVQPQVLNDHWCGASRPIFFRGVATVVAKLFHAVKPHKAYFGEKDYQQLTIVKRMVQELLFDVEIVGVPTVRESDGLAFSSRNVYLTPAERAVAPRIYAALQAAAARFAAGERDAARLTAALRSDLSAIPGAKLDYAGIADPDTLAPLETGNIKRGRVLVAVWLGQARLIDNLLLDG